MRHARRPCAATAPALAALLFLAGCGDGGGPGGGRGSASPSSPSASHPPPSGSPSASSGPPSGGAGVLDERQVTNALLAPGSLPGGWRTIGRNVTTLTGDVPRDLSTRDRNCEKLFDTLVGHLSGHEARTDAARDYRAGGRGRGPYLSSAVASYDGTDAIRTVSTFESVRDSCPKFRTRNKSVVIDFAVSPLKGAYLGEDSPGARLRGKAAGGPADGSQVTLDLVLARAGQNTTGTAVLSPGSGDAALTEDAARTALKRLQRVTARKTPSPTASGTGPG
ncbi:hypothetical protein [Streptomyces axinellae]|uniref:PknH-like extracellular domain-containing protein n=1 Tax=Streptomyces axinellae TaxID=552788 RepID=A0ABN3PPS8_9ACTN